MLRKDLLVVAYNSLVDEFVENDDCFSVHYVTDGDDFLLFNINYQDAWCDDRLVCLRICQHCLCHVTLTLWFDESRANDLLQLMTEWEIDEMFEDDFHKRDAFYTAEITTKKETESVREEEPFPPIANFYGADY